MLDRVLPRIKSRVLVALKGGPRITWRREPFETLGVIFHRTMNANADTKRRTFDFGIVRTCDANVSCFNDRIISLSFRARVVRPDHSRNPRRLVVRSSAPPFPKRAHVTTVA